MSNCHSRGLRRPGGVRCKVFSGKWLWELSGVAAAFGLPFAFPDVPSGRHQTFAGMTPPYEQGPDGMSTLRYFKRMKIEQQGDVLLLHIGEMDIWDGADLALLREGLTRLIENDRERAIVIDMRYVKYIPSGFFGMLFDWAEKRGVWFGLTPPQPNVQRMLWFRQFFQRTEEGWFELRQNAPDIHDVALEPEPELVEVEDSH